MSAIIREYFGAPVERSEIKNHAVRGIHQSGGWLYVLCTVVAIC